MVTDFQERLRQIREERDRETRARRDLEAAIEIERMTSLEQRFDRREQIEKTVASLSDKFMSELPGFERNKSFFEGKYKIEVGSDERRIFSRIAFLIDTTIDDGSIGVVCKKTVRNRDQDSTSIRVDIASTDIEEFAGFAEQQFIDFADLYFASAPASSR